MGGSVQVRKPLLKVGVVAAGYVVALARQELGWEPRHDFRSVVECLRRRQDFRSPLAHAVGSKGDHERTFTDGPYPVSAPRPCR